MAINNNVTFRRKHRPVWYGLLCLVLITAAVSTMSLIPAQSNDLSSGDSVGNYTLTDGNKNIIKSDDELENIIEIINGSEKGSVFTIIVNNNDTNFSGFTLSEGKEVTLKSSSDKTFTITKTSAGRHFTVASGATLTLGNIILDGGKDKGNIGGGIEVEKGGTLVMNDGAVIQKCSVPGTYAYGGGVHNYGTFTMNGGVISGNNAELGGGVSNVNSTFYMYGGVISGNNASEGGGGVFNMAPEARFEMSGGKISDNIVNGAAFDGGGGGVYNVNFSKFNMTGGEISGNKAIHKNYGGGGVYNGYDSTFTMSGKAVISGNIAISDGGGVFNFSTFIMNGGVISDNTAKLGGGVYNECSIAITITGGKISGNTATGVDKNGSGGGIYTEDFAILNVADGVVFSGNTAPTLRTKNIDDDAVLADYVNIGDKVVLSAPVNPKLNAPAYNNYDINYPGDAFVVTIVIKPSGNGTVTATYENKDTVYEGGYVYVPLSGDEITLSATPKSGGKFIQFTIGEEKFSKNSIVIDVEGNVTVVAEFLRDYSINATADSGSEITPSGTVKVLYGHDGVFKFSAKPGYKITAVFVNDVPISSAELASGEYTFRNVKSNHTIKVVSEADDGSGGGSDIGAGGSGGGSETGSGGNADSEWLIIGVVCVMLAVFSGAVALIVRRDRRRMDSGPEQP